MDVKSGYPWWPVRNGLIRQYRPLHVDCTCEVAVIGAGITGALIADALVDAGIETLVLDKRDVAWGSTSASTALLQYEIDTELVELGELLGDDDALRAYRACEQALREIDRMRANLGDIGYRRCDSIYLASSPRHVERLRREFAARVAAGFDTTWIEKAALQERFGLHAPAAVLSRPAAQVDPYRFAHALFARNGARGLKLFDRTEVAELECTPRHIVLTTAQGASVRTRWVVVAAGYETEKFLPASVARNRSSYAFVSEPLESIPDGINDVVGWETARPYVYWRCGDDGRMIVGGEDDAIDNAAKRDLRVGAKTKKLLRRMRKLLPELPLNVGFAWAGTFAETADGLPWFGRHPKCDPRVLFAMAYGGNGITYSAIGAHILCNCIRSEHHELASLFGFGRQTGPAQHGQRDAA